MQEKLGRNGKEEEEKIEVFIRGRGEVQKVIF